MVGDLMKYGVQVSGKADDEPNALMSALYYLGPTILIIVFWFYMMRQMQGGGKGGAFSFGKSRARLTIKPQSGSGSCTPSPRKPNDEASRIA